MRIYLQTRPDDGGNQRYYHLMLQEDLLEGWTLIKETGRQGASGKISKQQFDNREDAEMAMLKLRDSQLKRGYHVVFVQGQTRPE
ncbi:WGR domain-containing protein [Kaarinaea lacus]